MIRTLLFDLDGTLTDPELGITRCIAFALERYSLPVPDARRLRRCIGPPLGESFGELGAQSADVDGLIEAYRERYRETGIYENTLIEGIPELLVELADRGHELHVATSKPTIFAEQVLAHFEIRESFGHVFGSELDGVRSDKTDLLAHVRDELGMDPDATAMIGDRRHDIAGGRAHDLHTVGVLWGYGDHAELAAAGAHWVVSSPKEIPDVVS